MVMVNHYLSVLRSYGLVRASGFQYLTVAEMGEFFNETIT